MTLFLTLAKSVSQKLPQYDYPINSIELYLRSLKSVFGSKKETIT